MTGELSPCLFGIRQTNTPIKPEMIISRVLYLSVSIIYLGRKSLCGSSDLPPDIGRAGLSVSIHGLPTREGYGYSDHPEYR